MKTFTLLLVLLISAVFTFGQTQDYAPVDVSVLKTIRDNAAADSPLKTEWASESAIGLWTGVKWTESIPHKVIELELTDKKLTTCDLTKLDQLERLTCYGNPQLSLIGVNGLIHLKYLECWSNATVDLNKLTYLNLSGLINLETLYCYMPLKSNDIGSLKKLKDLVCIGSYLTSLDLSLLTNLESLNCSDNQLTSLNLKGLNNLKNVSCSNNRLETFEVSGLTNLENLDCQVNRLTHLDLRGLTSMKGLICSANKLASIDLSGLTKLNYLKCDNNCLPFSSLKTTLHLTLSPWNPPLGPQNPNFGAIKNVQVGDVLDLSSEADIDGTATEFTWYRNGQKIEGTDQSGRYKVEELAPYYCTMTNARFPGITLTSNIIFPTVVDHSKWFPPVRGQYTRGNCTHFALIYYLKSSIWNRQFNRDPNLEINQFNHNFVWDQNVNNNLPGFFPEPGFYFMHNQGCATMADFPYNDTQAPTQPSLEVRAKALKYKSKRLYVNDFLSCGNDSVLISKRLASLKDSLINGKCFILGIPVYKYMSNLTNENNIYNCYKGISNDSIVFGHELTIVGYNDTIKTAQGRGAFKVINSNKELADGKMYFDYNWFYFAWHQPFTYCFLEEDFSSNPKMVLNLSLNSAIENSDVENGNYIFTDTIVNQYYRRMEFNNQIYSHVAYHDSLLDSPDAMFDFENYYTYKYNRNQVQICSLNGKKVKLRNNLILIPDNYNGDNDKIVTDLTGLSGIENFKSLSVIVFDPISATYMGKNDQVIYSYQREATANVEKAFINFPGTDKNIAAHIQELNDTTITTGNFYSIMAGWHLKPQKSNIYIKACTSVLKRKLITFSIDDFKTDEPPLWVNIPTTDGSVYENAEYRFQLKATDPNGYPITYSIASGTGAIIDRFTGLFSYQNSQAGTYPITVKACDGVSDIFYTFNVRILSSTLPSFIVEPVSPVTVERGTEYKFKLVAVDPKGRPITYRVATSNTGVIDPITGNYSFTPSRTGNIQAEIWANNGVENIYSILHLVVTPGMNTPPVFLNQSVTLPGYANKTGTYQLKAIDEQNDPFTFSLFNNYFEGVQVSSSGEITYQLPPGNSQFFVAVSDGNGSTIAPISAWIVLTDAVSEITEAEAISVYPNPVSSRAIIGIIMKKQGIARITLFDLSGRQVDGLVSECSAGKNTIDYDASVLKSGIYLCRVTTSDSSQTIKIIKQ